MTWGHYARDPEWGVPEVARARLAKGVGPLGSTASQRPGAPHVQAILDLQRSVGNAAVARLLRPRVVGAPAAPIVQRQDEEYEDGGQSWGTDEEAASSSYSADDYSSGEAYGPPPPPEWGEAAPAEAAPTGGGGGSDWSGGGGGGGGEEAPAQEAPTTGGSGEGGGSSWWPFGGGGGGGSGGGEEAPTQEAPSGDEGGGSSWWPFGGGSEEKPSDDEGGGSSWWPFGGGDEKPAGGDDEGGGSSWWPFGGGDEEAGEEEGGPSAEDIARKIAEGETGSESDEFVPMGGGARPVAGAGGFHDDGSAGTQPYAGAATLGEDPEDLHPHAFMPGGATGTVTWSGGGGEGKGPKGNQESGSFTNEVVPKYDSTWGGIRTNASAFVASGTGTVDVHRSFVTSASGDQGNGWWVSPRAAAALTAHEQKHVTKSGMVYGNTIQPMLDRIASSAAYGREISYWGSDARLLVKQKVDWPGSLRKFKDDDQAWNAPNNMVDNEDIGAPHYPRNMEGPKTIEGKEYKFYAIMNDEKPA